MFFTHSKQETQDLLVSGTDSAGTQTGRVLTSSTPSLGSLPTGSRICVIQKPLPQIHIEPGQCYSHLQLSHVVVEQQHS